MDKKIEKMRETLKRKNLMAFAIILLSSSLSIIVRRPSVAALAANAQHLDFVRGFVTGMSIVLDIVFIYIIFKNYTAMKDDNKLMRLYNEMNDERMMKIESLAGKETIKISAVILLVLALISSFVSLACTVAIVVSIAVMAVVKVICKSYYTRSYTGEES